MTPARARLAELRKLEHDCTRPPWRVGTVVDSALAEIIHATGGGNLGTCLHPDDAAFCAALRNAAPWLLALAEAALDVVGACRKPALHIMSPDCHEPVPTYPELRAALARFDAAALAADAKEER